MHPQSLSSEVLAVCVDFSYLLVTRIKSAHTHAKTGNPRTFVCLMLQFQTVGVVVGSRDPVLTFLLMSFNRITVRSRVPRGGRESTPCHGS